MMRQTVTESLDQFRKRMKADGATTEVDLGALGIEFWIGIRDISDVRNYIGVWYSQDKAFVYSRD